MIDTVHFTPVLSLAGGILIGLAAALLILFNGRIAGISGILGGALAVPRGDLSWRLMFLLGLVAAPLLAALFGMLPAAEIPASWGQLLGAGFLVGIGTRFAGGCTSGHGVCGLARGALRSLVATITFMVFGFVTVFVVRHVIGG